MNLADRIRRAWLARNPSPDAFEASPEEIVSWKHNHSYLEAMLDCEAYESAVIQFLVPEGLPWLMSYDGLAVVGYNFGNLGNLGNLGNAKMPAEALLNAIEEVGR